ncbi:SpoIIE family protein phosphatase [Aliamphritea spongicola]|uniref:SpoIIE family protein phosphatase n=1 Tax=Aliamphritea spongicola TaxID=707589 RepID=UPI00196AA6A2|nr:SpoIIE family protein phosphatase [Aliamphritea spongicola]MBN3560847.1 SpoIIE family protein phosphatase [Aliamphritea spongicola]
MQVLAEWEFQPDLSAARELRNKLAALLEALPPEQSVANVQGFLLACSELVVNLTRYPQPRPTAATLRFCQDEFYDQLELLDDGGSFINFSQQLQDTSPLQAAENGMGLKLLAASFDDLSYVPACYRDDARNLMLVKQQRCHPRPTLLVVDDDPVYRAVVSAYLQSDYRVLEAADVAMGYEQVLQHRPELVICDISMPEADGPVLFDRMRHIPEVSGTAFIYLSGCQDDDVISRALQRPIDDFLAKPVARDKLLVSVQRTLLRRRHLTEQLQAELDQKITLGLQPSLPREIGEYQVALRSRVPEAGGGDMVLLRDQLVIFADMMGHGVTAKGYVYALAGYLRGLCAAVGSGAQSRLAPAQLLTLVSQGFSDDPVLAETLATLMAVQLNPEGEILIANAGQPRPVLCRANTESDDAVRQLDIDGPLPGLSLQQGAETAYPEYCLQLGDGERLLIYSDGVLDAAETPSETFISRIHDSMGMPLPQAADYLMQQLPADPQADDITLILLGRL